MPNPKHTVDLFTATFELHHGKIDEKAWLKTFTKATNAQSALCIRWPCGLPEKSISSVSGNYNKIPAGFSNWADHITTLAKPDTPMLMDELVRKLNQQKLSEANPIKDSQLLIALVDWHSNYIFIMVHRDATEGIWTAEEIDYFKSLCKPLQESILLHRNSTEAKNLAIATTNILNNAPRGIIALAPDGKVKFANRMAEQVFSANDGISLENDMLSFTHKESQLALNDFLTVTKKIKPKQLTYTNGDSPDSDSFKNYAVQRPSGHKPYLLMFLAVPLSTWTLDTDPSDRMVLIYINDPQNRLQPTDVQLISYYGLTSAQANVAVQLYASKSIVAAAEKLNISIHTARSHLRSIYTKTDTNNLPELVKILSDAIKPPWTGK
ncbi:MAG: hypothetical protein GY918_01045 [Gammaproteobacteria bacterium]|nr:hypothetical protein [Gammaproteobacteria bacterium]